MTTRYEYLAHHGSPEQIIEAFEQLFDANRELEEQNQRLIFLIRTIRARRSLEQESRRQSNQLDALQSTAEELEGAAKGYKGKEDLGVDNKKVKNEDN